MSMKFKNFVISIWFILLSERRHYKWFHFFIFIFCYKRSLAENRVLLCVSRHHHIAEDFLVQVKERKDSKLQVTGKNTQLAKASSTILVCRGNLISKSAVLRNVKVFSYIFSSYSIFLPIGWEWTKQTYISIPYMKACFMTAQISHLLKVRKSQKELFLKIHCPKSKRNFWRISALASRMGQI